ncbi:HAD family hydrolase [Oceanobacillus bengalensis]|uniref:HAD family hydrolase n=1 Tax=Oceanobacillus bengalensis TaxID=1435466 RepID=A0A494YZE0_9BACI|nr:HAD family hydrolase [Oceanobacillus bengalensis]RKQ15528.1 HAD family hydrolase [Oceanobacillus bengalensis]
MNVRAAFIDMDGTLLTTSNEISRRNAEAIYELINQGVHVFLATGRQYEITVPYHRALGLTTPMICLNGASIHDGLTGKAIQIKPISLDKDRLHVVTSQVPCDIVVHTATGLYCNQINVEIDGWIKEGQVPPRYVGDLSQANYQDVLKYSIKTGSRESELSELFIEEADIINWNDGFEIVARGVSKWAAIQSILKLYQINPANVVTFGDGPNDIQMLRHAGTGVAMANAEPEVKAVADFVTGHHERDGLAVFIERYLIQTFAI